MVNLRIEIKTDNDAMQHAHQVADALLVVEGKIRNGRYTGTIHDTNGNRVGDFIATGLPGRTDT